MDLHSTLVEFKHIVLGDKLSIAMYMGAFFFFSGDYGKLTGS